MNRTGLPLEKGTWEPSFDGNDSNAAAVFLLFAHASLSGRKKGKKHMSHLHLLCLGLQISFLFGKKTAALPAGCVRVSGDFQTEVVWVTVWTS